MPVRKVFHHGKNIIGQFPSRKLRRMVAYESLLELDFLYLLDYETAVEWFEEQPLTIEYWLNRKLYYYTPDFHVIRAGRNYLFECKPAALVAKEDNQRKFTAARRWCEEQAWQFEIVTDVQLRTGPYLGNVMTVTRYACLSLSDDMVRMAQHIVGRQPCPLRELAKQLSPTQPKQAEIAILGMTFNHLVEIDLTDGPLTPHSLVHKF